MNPRDRSQPKGRLTSALTTSCGLIALSRGGSGRPVLLLHDLASSRESFDPLIESLGAELQLVQIDLLGHGASDLRPTDLSISAQSEAVAEVIADLGFQQATIVGHSLGGSVAIHLAAYHPELVGKLVLISAGSYEYRFPLRWRLCRSRLGWRLLGLLGGPGAVERALRLSGATSGTLSRANDPLESRAGWSALGRAFRQSTSEAALSELEHLAESSIVHPTLVVWGTANRLLPVASARVFFQRRLNIRFVEVTDAGHAVHEVAPNVVADLIREFLG